MKFTGSNHSFSAQKIRRAVINTKSDITTNLPALTTSSPLAVLAMAGIFTYHVLSVIESLNMLKNSLPLSPGLCWQDVPHRRRPLTSRAEDHLYHRTRA
ncbi:hypothetical protein KCP76_16005 [Salmonella enterica subsp. enterica serovar Weltevreden]|nr:hypothetical protein KCP76_16005 [Salmonella enterica subsp. enterica serovar Weltevreden]